MDSEIYKKFDHRITGIAAIVIATVGVITYFGNPAKNLDIKYNELAAKIGTEQALSKQLQNIKDNDLHTLELKVTELQTENKQILQKLTQVETILNERLPAKR